jgi:hypothetical protein
VVIEAAALDDILASQAAAASGLDPIDWDAIEGGFRLPSVSGGDPQDFDAELLRSDHLQRCGKSGRFRSLVGRLDGRRFAVACRSGVRPGGRKAAFFLP